MKILSAAIFTLSASAAVGSPHEETAPPDEDFVRFEFQSYDANGDKSVSADEITAFYRSAGGDTIIRLVFLARKSARKLHVKQFL